MRPTLVICLSSLMLLVGTACGQWSAPTAISTGDQSNIYPAAAATGDHGLWAAWLQSSYLIKGSLYDGTNWSPVYPISRCTVGFIGPALAPDSTRSSVLLGYYIGSIPTDDDTWGIYSAAVDSTGNLPRERVCYAPGLGVADLRMAANDRGQTGVIYVTGNMIGTPEHIEFICRRDSTWSDSLWVAAGMEYPPYFYASVGEPRIAGGPGDTFFLANWNYVNDQGSIRNTVGLLCVPPDSGIGDFDGKDPELINNPADGRLYLAYCAGTSTDSVLGVRSYTRSQGWSALQPIDSSWMAYSSQSSLTTDVQGYVWLAYTTGTGAGRTVQARYAWAGYWSEPETVAVDSGAANPAVAADNSGRVWVLWARTLGFNQSQIFAAYRELRPGIANGLQPATHGLQLEVCPNPCRDRAEICLPLAAGRWPPGIRIYNQSGRLVRTLFLAPRPSSPAPVVLTWDCRDQTGARVPAGCYFVCLSAGNKSPRRKVVVSE